MVVRTVCCSIHVTLAGTALLVVAGCAGRAGDEDVGEAESAMHSQNALTANALTANALTANALTANALTANALTANALTANALTAGALQDDAAARVVLKYIVGCALPADAHFDLVLNGTTYGYDGQLGLAPSWGHRGGSCDHACQGWVSACVLSRVNYLGERVPISIRGHVGQLSSNETERQAYPNREATYYGDIFRSPQLRYGCLSPGATSDPRVCGPSIDDCVIQFAGTCDQACDNVQCDGSFPNCRDVPRDEQRKFPAGTVAYDAAVTVFLQ